MILSLSLHADKVIDGGAGEYDEIKQEADKKKKPNGGESPAESPEVVAKPRHKRADNKGYQL